MLPTVCVALHQFFCTTDRWQAVNVTSCNEPNACTSIFGRSFTSAEPQMCDAANGPFECTWGLTFTGGNVETQRFATTGSFDLQCDGMSILAVQGDGSVVFTGEYDPASDSVTFDGVLYIP